MRRDAASKRGGGGVRARAEHAAHHKTKNASSIFLSRASLSRARCCPGVFPLRRFLRLRQEKRTGLFLTCLKKALRHTENCVTHISSPSPSNTERRCKEPHRKFCKDSGPTRSSYRNHLRSIKRLFTPQSTRPPGHFYIDALPQTNPAQPPPFPC